MDKELETKIRTRIHSLDMTRGLIVILSVFFSNLPDGGYEFLRHVKWYGISAIDFILPIFITLFGTSMAIAYKKGINWSRLVKRTFKLVIFGLIFNMIVAWSLDFSTLRFTGVLQMFAVLGILAVLITRVFTSPVKLTLIGLLIFISYGGILLYLGSSCEGGLPQPSCNPSGIIDPVVFGAGHVYNGGKSGFDPEGLPIIFVALGNVLCGYAAGRFLVQKDKVRKELILHGALLIGLGLLFTLFIPIGKRLWTPSFGLMAAGMSSWLLAIFHTFFDHSVKRSKTRGAVIWFMDAFGRNSFLIYFGKYILYSLLIHLSLQAPTVPSSLYDLIYGFIQKISQYPQLTYAALILLFWTVIALMLHKFKWYLKV